MYAEMLIDRMTGGEARNIGGRVPRMDEDTYEIMSEEAIVTYIAYLDQLRPLFLNHIHQNYNSEKRVYSWRDIE